MLIVDEPTRGIDVGAKMEVYQLLDQLAARGAAILMISSDLPEVLGMSDRVLVMHQGRIGAIFDRRTPRRRVCCTPRSGCTEHARRIPGRRLGTVAGLFALCVLLWILTPHFLTVSNLLNVLEQTAINAIIAAGMTFVIISAGIDLSVGSLVAVAGVALASGLNAGQPVASRSPSLSAWASGSAC